MSIPLRALALTLLTIPLLASADEPFLVSELIFPLEQWHNHGSCIVEAPNGNLLVCWFHGSGERQSDDVSIRGARFNGGWSDPFTMADVPGFPDTNCCMIVDPQQRLWLLWPTILANSWESSIMNYKISSQYAAIDGPPVWDSQQVLFMKPEGDETIKDNEKDKESIFATKVRAKVDEYVAQAFPNQAELPEIVTRWKDLVVSQANDKLTRRLGWFTRAHPVILADGRMLVGLYSDGFSFSLVAYTDNLGKTWGFSDPIVGGGNIQPSFAVGRDGVITAYMRDNGPPPKRVMVSQSRDRGETWSMVEDHPDLPNPGAGLEVMSARNGDFVLIYNDLEKGRHSLAVAISEDAGKTWKYKRHLELAEEDTASFHYPSIIEAKDGTFHASYSYFIDKPAEGQQAGKSIKHAHFNRAWIMAGDGQ